MFDQYRFSLFRKLQFSEVRNDSEPNTRYVRVLDPTAPEISFIRTDCEKKEALYVACANLGNFIQCEILSMNTKLFSLIYRLIQTVVCNPYLHQMRLSVCRRWLLQATGLGMYRCIVMRRTSVTEP